MHNELKKNLKQTVSFSSAELDLVDHHFERKTIKKKEFLLQENMICSFIGFINQGCIRHFHVKNGVEKTCDISFDNAWITDFHSLISGVPGMMNLQAMSDTDVCVITQPNLAALYQACGKYETFGRLMAEQVAQRATEIAMSLSSDKPEERFQNLIKNRPDLFQRVPQKYIASFLGISPESLSRIRNRIFQKQKS